MPAKVHDYPSVNTRITLALICSSIRLKSRCRARAIFEMTVCMDTADSSVSASSLSAGITAAVDGLNHWPSDI